MNNELFEDIQELCVCCAKSIVVISSKHNENPKFVSKLFLDIFTKIVEDLLKS